jgi:hypothetical protein
MPSPSTSLASVQSRNSDLGGSIEEFNLMAEAAGYIGSRVAPVMDVDKVAGTFGRIPVEQLLQERETLRAPGAGYSRGTWTFVPDTYATQEHGTEEPVDENEAEMFADYFDAELVSRNRAAAAVLRNAEKRWAARIFDTAVWTGSALTTAITNEWDDFTNAVPINDVEGAVRKMWDSSGIWANALIINRHVFRNLRLCAQVIDRITASGAGRPAKPSDITEDMLAAVFDIPNIIVGGGAKATNKEGASAAFGKIWSDEYAMVCRIAESNDVREPCIARTLHWAKDGSSVLGAVEDYEEPQTRSKIIRVRHQVAEKIMYVEAGHLLSNITT